MSNQPPPNTTRLDAAFLQGFALGVIQGRDLAREECVAPACLPAQPTTLAGDPVAAEQRSSAGAERDLAGGPCPATPATPAGRMPTLGGADAPTGAHRPLSGDDDDI
ncbi:MAG: hypothetical protein ABIO70_06515 [Pseudomonadota bacterium]